MNTNVNLAAPVGALALLGTGLVFFLAAVFLIESLIVRKRTRAKVIFVAMAGLCALYLLAMAIFSVSSHEKLLARGEEKHFCELDCHLAYSVIDARRTRTIGEGANQLTAKGSYLLVTIKTRFDETTIAPWRGNGQLTPDDRALTLIDQNGNRYAPVRESGSALTTPLRPGESYTTEVAFDVSTETSNPILLINESDWITHLVIGHENSPLHKQAKFRIDLPAIAFSRSQHIFAMWQTTLPSS